jgi:hypothetical protein
MCAPTGTCCEGIVVVFLHESVRWQGGGDMLKRGVCEQAVISQLADRAWLTAPYRAGVSLSILSAYHSRSRKKDSWNTHTQTPTLSGNNVTTRVCVCIYYLLPVGPSVWQHKDTACTHTQHAHTHSMHTHTACTHTQHAHTHSMHTHTRPILGIQWVFSGFSSVCFSCFLKNSAGIYLQINIHTT